MCIRDSSDFAGSRVYACLGVTCHLHFWQNYRGHLLATALTRGWGWNGHLIRVSTTKLTLEKKILPPLLPGFELATFRSRVRHSYQQATLAPLLEIPASVNELGVGVCVCACVYVCTRTYSRPCLCTLLSSSAVFTAYISQTFSLVLR